MCKICTANSYQVDICKYLWDWGVQISIESGFYDISETEVSKYLWDCVLKISMDWDVQIYIGVRFANMYGMGLRCTNIYQIMYKYLLYWDVHKVRSANIYGIEACKYLCDWDLQISMWLRFANIYRIEVCKYIWD